MKTTVTTSNIGNRDGPRYGNSEQIGLIFKNSVNNSDLQYHIHDHVYSTVALTNVVGAVQERHE